MENVLKKKNKIKTMVADLILILVCVVFLTIIHYSFGLSTKRTLAVAVICMGSILVHCYKAARQDDYYKLLLGLKLRGGETIGMTGFAF